MRLLAAESMVESSRLAHLPSLAKTALGAFFNGMDPSVSGAISRLRHLDGSAC
jgi:hypothetical protein